MQRESIRAALFALFALVLPSSATAPQEFGHFDRLAVVQRFLDEVYPDLKHIHGLILARSEAFHRIEPQNLAIGGQQIDIVPCRTGSGVPGEGVHPQNLPVPHCTGLFLSGFSEFLTLSVGYSEAFPIAIFYARGGFVDGRSQAAKQEIWDHPEWARPEWTEAVLRARPRFGPAQKQEFVQSIPERTMKAIHEFTGCQLDPETASFWVDRLGNKPDPMHVEIQWMVSGKTKPKPTSGGDCQATFEPFEGKLLAVR